MTFNCRLIAGRRYFCLLFILVAILPGLLGQNEGDSIPAIVEEPVVAGQVEDLLSNWWAEYRKAKQVGDPEAQERAYQNFLDLKEIDGSEIFELGSFLFLEEGFNDLKLQKYD